MPVLRPKLCHRKCQPKGMSRIARISPNTRGINCHIRSLNGRHFLRVFGSIDMPFTYQIDVERQLVITTASGVVTPEEVLEHQRRLAKDPLFDPRFSQLLDLTQATRTDIHAEDVRAFAARSIFAPGSRRAFVA